MAIHYPPQYRYSLFDDWDHNALALITKIGTTKKYPQIFGTKVEINNFLKILIRTQKSLNDWRALLVDVLDQVKKTNTINTKVINNKYPPESISKEEPVWVTYEEDRIVSQFIDSLETKDIDFIGTNTEVAEFTIRFILGQIGHDWEQTIILIWEMLGNESKLKLKELNNEFKNFDYLKLFKN